MDWWLVAVIGLCLAGLVIQIVRAQRRKAVRRAENPPRTRSLRPNQFRKTFSTGGRAPTVTQPPYAFARIGHKLGTFRDLSQDADPARLARWKLPVLRTPDELAAWLKTPVNRLAWLSHHCTRGVPPSERQAHYHFRWVAKRSGGQRLIEAPKPDLKRIQTQILEEILNRVPASKVAHGFVAGRSIRTNAANHTGRPILLKIDLRNFYASVKFNRIVAIYRRLGYSREVGIWLARLTTSALPGNLPFPQNDPEANWAYRGRHLPQGAPTSPALANLSAYWLDQRLAGMSRKWGVTYTRYADDLTFSAGDDFSGKLRVFIQLVERIICSERFRSRKEKRQVLRAHQRQMVTGVVVNAGTNVARHDFDRLKAVLHNCLTHGPSTQNREQHPHFAEHLRGRIAHVQQLNPRKAARLQAVYARIDWTR